MENKYSNVCRKIIENYSNFISEKEMLAIKKIIKLNNYDNLNIIIFINKIIDRIWQMILTKPISYKEGKKFTFLTSREIIPVTLNVSNIKELSDFKIHSLRLITQDNVTENTNNISGMIVECDFSNPFIEPILPIDFEEQKEIYVKTKLNIKGLFNISLGLKEFDIIEKEASSFASSIHLPMISILKPIYNLEKNQILLDSLDKESIIDHVIDYYIFTNNLDKKNNVFEIKSTLKKAYKTKIINKYIKFSHGEILLEDFITYTFNLFENDGYLQKFDKIV